MMMIRSDCSLKTKLPPATFRRLIEEYIGSVDGVYPSVITRQEKAKQMPRNGLFGAFTHKNRDFD